MKPTPHAAPSLDPVFRVRRLQESFQSASAPVKLQSRVQLSATSRELAPISVCSCEEPIFRGVVQGSWGAKPLLRNIAQQEADNSH